MPFVPPKPGGWNAQDKLTSAQMNALQVNISAADAQTINGVTGGVYTPAAVVDIDRLGGRVRAADQILLDQFQSLKVSNQVVRFEHSMVPRYMDMPFGVSIGIPTWECTFGSGGPCSSWRQYNVDQPFGISFALGLPDGAILSELGFTFTSAGHTVVPATRPKFYLQKHERATGLSTNLFVATDPITVLASYNALRTYQANAAAVSGVTTNLLPYTGESGCHYSITLAGESGADSIAQALNLHGIYADIAIQRIEPLGRL